MADSALLGPWIRRFLVEYLVSGRNLALNTQKSYRDTLRQLLPFVASQRKRKIDRLRTEDLSAQLIQSFLQDLKESRGCCSATRNQRLAAIRSLAHFIGTNSPEHISWCGELHTIPFRKTPRKLIGYLEKPEMEAFLDAPDRTTPQGQRDYTLLLFLYNSGARASEAAHVLIEDLQLGLRPEQDSSSVLIRGKGNKQRRCPLWARTVKELNVLIQGRGEKDHVFLNQRKAPLTRYGIHSLVERYSERLGKTVPSLATKKVSPHTIRHTTATYLLRSGGGHQYHPSMVGTCVTGND